MLCTVFCIRRPLLFGAGGCHSMVSQDGAPQADRSRTGIIVLVLEIEKQPSPHRRLPAWNGRFVNRFMSRAPVRFHAFSSPGRTRLMGAVFWIYSESLQAGFVGMITTFWRPATRCTSQRIVHRGLVLARHRHHPGRITAVADPDDLHRIPVVSGRAGGTSRGSASIHIAASPLIVPLFYLSWPVPPSELPPLRGVGGAYIFALHPRHAEPACMINGWTDSLRGLFFLASLVAYIFWRRGAHRSWHGISARRSRAPRCRRKWWSRSRGLVAA